MQRTLVDLFELRNLASPSEYVPPQAPRELALDDGIDLEIAWEDADAADTAEEHAHAGEHAAEHAGEHDWDSATTESSPGVSIESWRRARGWCTE